MKIISWNVNGIRAWEKKGCWDFIKKEDPDIFCVQESKAEKEQLGEDLANPQGYFSYFNSSKERKGYSGTVVYTKIEPKKVTYGMGIKDLDGQGRQINLFFKDFVLINCYFPNGGGPIERLFFKLRYYKQFLKFINKIRDEGYKIIFCGDLNVAHDEIDIARPKENENKVGFLREERDWVDDLILNDYFDTFREIYPKTIRYSWWDMKTRARDRNIGWRIDYFFVDKTIFKKVKKSEIMDDVLGSDHAPCFLEIDL